MIKKVKLNIIFIAMAACSFELTADFGKDPMISQGRQQEVTKLVQLIGQVEDQKTKDALNQMEKIVIDAYQIAIAAFEKNK